MMTLNICILLVLLMWNSAVRFTSALELAQHFESTIVATVPATEAAFEILGIVLVVLELQVRATVAPLPLLASPPTVLPSCHAGSLARRTYFNEPLRRRPC